MAAHDGTMAGLARGLGLGLGAGVGVGVGDGLAEGLGDALATANGDGLACEPPQELAQAATANVAITAASLCPTGR